jgi:hypothetical protein
MKRKAYLDASIREEVLPMLRIVLAILRAQALSYQTSHWQARGPNYYGNHLLFERLYGSVQAEIDAIGEKLVGYFGVPAVDLEVSLTLINDMIERWHAEEDMVRRGLLSEQELQKALSFVFDVWPERSPMPIGLDDWLMATANAHESNIYLLQQVLDEGFDRQASRPKAVPDSRKALIGYSGSMRGGSAPSAEGHFFKNPRKRETREFAESGAPTNISDVGHDIAEIHGDGDVLSAVRRAPPTPTEILKHPGSEGASTLSRLVLDSEDPSIKPAAEHHRRLMAAWSFLPQTTYHQASLDRQADELRLKNVEALMGLGKSFGVLSPYRGDSSKSENQDSSGELIRMLADMGYKKLYPVQGKWKDKKGKTHTERSYMVPEISFEDLHKLGDHFKQDAVIYKSKDNVIGMYYPEQKKAVAAIKADGSPSWSAEVGKNLYSKGRGISFDLGFDWDTTHPWTSGSSPLAKSDVPKLLDIAAVNRPIREAEEAKAAAEKAKKDKKKEEFSGFDKYMKTKWDDGKKKVRNPNPENRDRFKEVTFSTAMKDKRFRDGVVKDFRKWKQGESAHAA